MRTRLRLLGTTLWLRYARLTSGDAKVSEFVKRFDGYVLAESDYGMNPCAMRAWADGVCSVSEGMVDRVESRVPGTKYVCAISALLTPSRLSGPASRRLLAAYIVEATEGVRTWHFPDSGRSHASTDDCEPCRWDDSERLGSRGDFLGFLAILVLMREAMARNAVGDFQKHATNMYQALPAIIRLPWVLPDSDRLVWCIEQFLEEHRESVVLLWRIKTQIGTVRRVTDVGSRGDGSKASQLKCFFPECVPLKRLAKASRGVTSR